MIINKLPLKLAHITETGVVKMVIYGAVVDEAYSRVLMQKTDLPLVDIIALDHVQKGRELDEERIKHLRKLKLIEGRKPNFHISATVASATDQKAEYIRMRAQDDAFYAKLVLDFIEKFGSATRKDINSLLFSKLSELLSEKQKTIKINSLITKMRRSALIENEGSDKKISLENYKVKSVKVQSKSSCSKIEKGVNHAIRSGYQSE